MSPLDPNTCRLPPALRALAMGLVVDTVMPKPNTSPQAGPAPAGNGAKNADPRAASWQDLQWKCDELLTLALQTDDPEEAAAYVLGYFPRHFRYVFELLGGRKGGHVSEDAVYSVGGTGGDGCRYGSCNGVPSQNLMVPSSPAEASRFPSGLNATARRVSVCPCSARSSCPAASQTLTAQSSPAEASRPPVP